MSMMLFRTVFPALAERETRSLGLSKALVKDGRVFLPADEYAFIEFYCADPGCDCRRVVMGVVARRARGHLATINHSFEPPSHDAQLVDQTFLDPLFQQSRWSEALLTLFICKVIPDPEYRQRLLRHYHLFKAAVADPTHPCQCYVRDTELEDAHPNGASRRSPIPPPARRMKPKWR